MLVPVEEEEVIVIFLEVAISMTAVAAGRRRLYGANIEHVSGTGQGK